MAITRLSGRAGYTGNKAQGQLGTVGVRTKKPEYVLNLEVSLLIKDELVRRGIEVAMTRETHEVDISNKQRADMANEAGAALAVRIHADGDSSPKTKGFSVLYPSASQNSGEAHRSRKPRSRWLSSLGI